MKVIQLYILLFLNSFFVLGQKKDFAIKIYLEDAYTGKNIKDAKVTLEGFEIPEIVGNYDKKGKFYYFTEIPEGYNTVMAYHKKYNEKGLQDKTQLPKSIKLKLYDPLNVSNEVFTLKDSVYSYSLGKMIESKYVKNIFVEDPYKIVLFFTNMEGCFTLENIIKQNNFEIELINPLNKNVREYINSKPKISCDCFSKNDFVFYDYFEDYSLTGQYNSKGLNKNQIFSIILRKKDGTKFKRFNDPIIKNLNDNLFSVNFIIYPKYLYDKDKQYKPKYTEYLDNMNYEIKQEDKSRVFLYNNHGKNKKVFDVISLEKQDDIYIENLDHYIYDLSIIQYKDLGLGIIDQYEYFYRKHSLK